MDSNIGIHGERAPGWVHYGASAFAGTGMALTYPDYGLWPLAWFTVAPFLFTLRGRAPHHGAWLGFVFGLFYFGPTLTWLSNTMTNYGHMPVWLAALVNALAVVIISLFTAFFGWLTAWIGRKTSGDMALLCVPVIWVAVELFRSHLPILAFPWARLADGQYLFLSFIQIADFCGEEGAGFLIMLVNAVWASMIWWMADKSRRFPIRLAAVAFILFVSSMVYGQARLAQSEKINGAPVPVALLQGNIDQARKWDRGYQREQVKMYIDMTLKASAHGAKLVVWPEAAATFYFGKDPYYDGLIRQVAQMAKVTILFGAVDSGERDGKRISFNSAWILDMGGHAEKYDKVRLAPFGEFVPLPKLLFFVHQIAHSIGDVTPGDQVHTLDAGGLRLGPQICFEIIFPQYSAQLAAMGAGAIVTITNDSWFGMSPASRQSMSMAVFRAVENRIPVLRAAQSGVSAIIGPDGRITAETPLFVKTTLFGQYIPRTGPPTFYSLYGWLIPWFFALGGVAIVVWTYIGARRAGVPGAV
ncbi:MAG: apolipoprotein N-acyltransferase [Nitrospinota bacterium]|nr:apolipoprotein N-acyltransferase [Nitrospinota bacterium]